MRKWLRFVVIAILYAGCDEAVAPAVSECQEQTYTTRDGEQLLDCRILWCHHISAWHDDTSGGATLFCHPRQQ